MSPPYIFKSPSTLLLTWLFHISLPTLYTTMPSRKRVKSPPSSPPVKKRLKTARKYTAPSRSRASTSVSTSSTHLLGVLAERAVSGLPRGDGDVAQVIAETRRGLSSGNATAQRGASKVDVPSSLSVYLSFIYLIY